MCICVYICVCMYIYMRTLRMADNPTPSLQDAGWRTARTPTARSHNFDGFVAGGLTFALHTISSSTRMQKSKGGFGRLKPGWW